MKSIFKIFMILSGIIILGNSCKKDNGSTTDNGVNQVISNNGNFTVKGSSNFEFSLELENAAYKVTFKNKVREDLTKFEIYVDALGEWSDVMPSEFMALRTSNWYEGSIKHSYKKGTFKFKATASGQYEITFEKLPLSQTAVYLPKSFSGAGGSFFGPMSITGTATFTIKCTDAKESGFTVKLLDATTGEEILNTGYKSLYVNLDANNNAINNINTSVLKSGLSGVYLLEVMAHWSANYSIDIN